MLPIARGRFRLAQLLQLGHDLDATRFDLAVIKERLRCWIQNDQTLCPVDQNMPPGFELGRNIVQAHNRRNIQRARNDRRMRSAAAQIGRDAQHAFPVHHRGIRRRQVVGHQNMRFVQFEKCLLRFSLQIANHALGYVLDVERPLAQVGIVDLAECFCVIGGDFLEHPLDITPIRFEFAQHFIDQCAVFHDQKVRIENGGILGADRFGDALLQFQNLHARLDERGLKARDFIGNLRRSDLMPDNIIEIVADHMRSAARGSRRDARSLKSSFLSGVIRAHSPARVQ